MPRKPPDSSRDSFALDVARGLGSAPKFLDPKYFYDAAGSELFELITEQPEYYQTRTEAELLQRSAPALSSILGDDVSVVELGSGSSAKTTILLDSFALSQDALHYVPIDISPTMLRKTADRLSARYPKLSVTPIASPYESGLARASTLVAENERAANQMLGFVSRLEHRKHGARRDRPLPERHSLPSGVERRFLDWLRPAKRCGDAERRL